MRSLKRNFALVKRRGVKPYTPAKWAFGSIMPPLAWAQTPKKKKKREGKVSRCFNIINLENIFGNFL